MSENLIEIDNLFVEYNVDKGFLKEKQSIYAVNGVSLDIKQGEIYSIAGESGCGKSTLAKTILRLVEAKSGGIFFKEGKKTRVQEDTQKVCALDHREEVAAQATKQSQEMINVLNLDKKSLKKFRQKAQIVFQNPYSSLNPKMKIYDILKEPFIINKELESINKLSSKDINDKIIETLKNVGLGKNVLDLYPHEFSGGQRQRIAIARALVLNPKFIVADEPVSALDVSIQAQIINLLNDLKEKYSLTFLFISHDLNVIKYLSDRVGIMYLGEIVEEGTSEEIFNSAKHPYTQALLAANPGCKEKIVLKGDLPSPANPPSGCKFHTRCPHVMEICKTKDPELSQFSSTHCAKCHLY